MLSEILAHLFFVLELVVFRRFGLSFLIILDYTVHAPPPATLFKQLVN
jgi:hypothetical protein